MVGNIPLMILIIISATIAIIEEKYDDIFTFLPPSFTYSVEQGFSPHGDIEGDVKVRLVTASVKLHISGIFVGCIDYHEDCVDVDGDGVDGDDESMAP